MALFRKKKTEEKGETKAPQEEKKGVSVAVTSDRAKIVLVDPRITEKATIVTEHGAYVFNVHPKASKGEIAKAIQTIYRVMPRKVNVVNIPAKRTDSRSMRMKSGSKAGRRKAYVYLKEGDTLEIV